MTQSETNRSPGAAVLAPIFAGTFIALLDLSIVIVALPTIQNELHTDVTGAQWIVDAFVLPLGALLLSGGALGDRCGRRRIFLGALAVFLAGSVFCATATTLGVLLAGRVLQGIAAAAIVPGALSLVSQLEPDPQRRARLIGLWAMVSGLSFVLGPLLGGALVDALGWQAIFYVNVPIVLAAIAVGMRTISESADPDHASLDPLGQLAAACALGTLTYAVIEGRDHGWGSDLTIGLFAAAAAAGAALVLVELAQRRPMLPVRLFTDLRFAIVNTAALGLGLGGNGAFFLLSLYLQQARGHSAFTTGLLTLPMTLAVIPGARLAGSLTAEHGPRRAMLAGFALTGVALLGLIAIGADTTYLPIGLLFVLAGCGQGLAIPATMAAALEIVPRQRSGVGSATVNAARQTGTVLGIAILGTILADHIASAAPATFSHAFVDGLRPGLLTAGLIVLASAGLLLAMPTPRAAGRLGGVPSPMPEVTIEPIAPDAPEAVSVLRSYYDEVISRYHGRPATEAEIEALMRDEGSEDLVLPHGVLLVARHAGSVLGCAGLRLVGGGVGEVTRVYVPPAARGRGLGSRLLQEIEEAARRQDVSLLRLDTRSDLVEARRLYLRHGYEAVAPFNSEPYAEHWFAKSLATG